MIKGILKAIFFAFFLLSMIVLWLFFTTSGLNTTLSLVKKIIPGELSIESLSGKLRRSLQLNGIEYRDADWHIYIEKVDLTWHPGSLLLEKLVINNLSITGLTITELSKTSTSQTKKFSIPLDLDIRYAELTKTILHTATDQTYSLDRLQLISVFTKQYPSDIIQLNGNWENLNFPIEKNILVKNQKGSLQLTGTVDNYQLNSDFSLKSPTYPAADIRLQATGNLNGWQDFWLIGKTLEGETSLRGNLQWLPAGLKWDVLWDGKSLQPNKQWSTLPRNIDFSVKTAGEFNAQNHHGYITLLHLSGDSQNQPLIAQGGMQWKNKDLYIKPTLITFANNHLQLSGQITQQWDINWKINLTDLTQVDPAATGNIATEGSIKGPRATPLLNGKIAVENLHFKQILMTQLTGDFSIDPSLNHYPQIDITGIGLQIDKVVLDTLQIQTQPEGNKQNITVNVESSKNTLTLKLLGEIFEKKWQGNVAAFTIQHQHAGNWQLTKSTPLLFSREKNSLENTCLVQASQQVCFNGQWTNNKQWKMNVTGNGITFVDALHAFNPSLSTTAALKFKGGASKSAQGKVTASLNAQLNPSELTYTQNKKTQSITFKGGELSLSLNEKGLQSQLQIFPTNSKPLIAKFALPKLYTHSLPFMQQPLTAELTFATSNLQLLSVIAPQLQTLSGDLNLNFTASGSLGKPSIKGSGTFSNGEFAIPETGAKFTNIAINATTDQFNTIRYTGKAQAGKGSLQISGQTIFAAIGSNTQIKIDGKNVQVFNTQDGQVEASPALTIIQKGNRIDLTGTIDIPRASIVANDFPSTVNLSPDVVFVTENQPQSTPLQFYSQVKLTIGNDVKVDAMGLKTQLAGSLDLRDSPNSATVAIGQLETVHGQYEAYGHNLTITEGKLIYTGGPIDNPGLSIKATKQRQTFIANANPSEESPTNYNSGAVVVGVQVIGTLNEPRMTLFSEPAGMNQSEILSYLVLGKPLNKSEGNDSQLLLSALSALPLGGTESGGGVEQQIKQGLGLDQVNVTSTETYDPEQKSMVENTALVLGKALSPKLFLSYTVGLVQSLNLFNITYKLSDHWQVQTEAGVSTAGIDLFYTYERD